MESWWLQSIPHFSKGRLTYATDRLLAISGLAKREQDRIYCGDEYLAGMWRSELVIGLLWMASDPDRNPVQVADYLAPSWSWASLNKAVGYDEAILRPNKGRHQDQNVSIHVEDVYTILEDPAQPLGRVTDGKLRISFQEGIMVCFEQNSEFIRQPADKLGLICR